VRKTEPIDRTLSRDQGGCVAVTDHRVIFNGYGQGLPPHNCDRRISGLFRRPQPECKARIVLAIAA
jgi:hypothetical protein